MEGNATTENLLGITQNVADSMTGTMGGEGIYTPTQVGTIVCFMVGVWHMLFGILQLGSLSVFLSDMLVSGFTTAAAFHVLTSQVKDLLGLNTMGASGPFKIIYIYVEILKSLGSVNLLTLVITLLTLTVLVINNEVLKPIVSKYSKVPVPIELIVVAIGTTASYFATLSETYNVKIIGDIPTGFPPATTPPMELMGKVLVDSLVIAIVSYTINFSLAKLFAAKHNHSVDATQELYATGVGNIVSSFFSCAPTGSALARALIQEAVGGITQMASLIVCALIVLVLLFIGPVFETLPKAVLASIIVVALKGMFMQVKDMVAMWKISRIEAAIWLVTFFSTVLIDIDFGLAVGVVFSLLVLLSKNQRPNSYLLGRVPNTDIYLDPKMYPQAKEIPGMKLFKIVGPIHFANRENLRRFIVKGTCLDPDELQKIVKKQTKDEDQKEEKIIQPIENGNYTFHDHELKIRVLILDCNGISYIDSSGGKFLAQLRKDYEKANINLCLAGLTENVYEIMEKTGSLKIFSSDRLFHSLHDAVVILKS
ncbi:Sulfate transporter [Armadillidium nasatum]|uniref:Sulfate transporter n=1 Tax=Armadillidium nasatum TaxID=96803 RepID=A0A5N5TCI8_9CRUS|nr:Sulfate transporter [Armadillidium nasatum]